MFWINVAFNLYGSDSPLGCLFLYRRKFSLFSRGDLLFLQPCPSETVGGDNSPFSQMYLSCRAGCHLIFSQVSGRTSQPGSTSTRQNPPEVGNSDGKTGAIVVYEFLDRIRVPTPSSVKISSITACCTRPSIICAVPTPACTASSAQRIFGSIPP